MEVAMCTVVLHSSIAVELCAPLTKIKTTKSQILDQERKLDCNLAHISLERFRCDGIALNFFFYLLLNIFFWFRRIF